MACPITYLPTSILEATDSLRPYHQNPFNRSFEAPTEAAILHATLDLDRSTCFFLSRQFDPGYCFLSLVHHHLSVCLSLLLIMEASSPLAAMHPPAAPSFGHPDMFRSRGHAVFNGESRGSGILFRDRIMPKTKPDYFNVKGSSPTASLAADLSQNFRIDNESRYLLPQSQSLSTKYQLSNPDWMIVPVSQPHAGPFSRPTL